jgi:hypothetical protein
LCTSGILRPESGNKKPSAVISTVDHKMK